MKALEACFLDPKGPGQEHRLQSPGPKLALGQGFEGPGSLFLGSKGPWLRVPPSNTRAKIGPWTETMILDMGKVNCLKALEGCSLDIKGPGQERQIQTLGPKWALGQ